MSPGAAPFQPFFLPAAHGERFCIFHPAAGTARGAVVYLHPFAEEMNKSRRMAALQSRMLAAHGFGVLQIDLFGCGDSSGDFADASWDVWREDVALAVRWIRRRFAGPLHVWGLRLGALLGLDYARTCEEEIQSFLLWQPITSGSSFLTQFLRLCVAAGIMSDAALSVSTEQLRGDLKKGAALEIAGYELSATMAGAIDSLEFADLAPQGHSVLWLEIGQQASASLAPASRRVADAWASHGIAVDGCCVSGPPFWNTIEISECPDLLAQTTRLLLGRAQ